MEIESKVFDDTDRSSSDDANSSDSEILAATMISKRRAYK